MDIPAPNLDHNGVDRNRLSTVSYDQKWDVLKPFMHSLYSDLDIGPLAEAVTRKYGFTAQIRQYKYRFGKWGWKKNVPAKVTAKVCNIRRARAKEGKRSTIKYKGKVVEDKQLRRYLKESTRRDVAQKSIADGGRGLKLMSGSAFSLGKSIFLNWNLPHGNMRFSNLASIAASPASLSTPSDVVVATPSSNEMQSPRNAPSPLAKIQLAKEAIERAHMFIEGRYEELLKSMSKEDRITMSNWLYQFWFHGFKTAKHWGRGPRFWDAFKLGFAQLDVGTPVAPGFSPQSTVEPRDFTTLQASESQQPLPPTSLCRWSIHYELDMECEFLPSRTPSPAPDPNTEDEKSWKPWPEEWKEPPYESRLLRNLATNDFSNIQAESLPIAVSQVVKVSEASTRELLVEALGFSIMARNAELTARALDDLVQKAGCQSHDLDKLHLFHLAATYLDGSKSCCTIFDALAWNDTGKTLRTSTRNDLGYTVVDSLMMTILRAHTTILPREVDESLRDDIRLPGEEADVCGRWDADSEAYRALIQNGDPRVPAVWKHKFCHTSAQAVCHFIFLLNVWSIEIGDDFITRGPSGLFLKRCGYCRLKMQVNVLQALVLTTVALASHGKEDEDLFGMVAILLEMLSIGACPLYKREISVPALFPNAPECMDVLGCNHQEMSPVDLIEAIPQSITERWSPAKKTGWELLWQVLRMSSMAWEDRAEPSATEDEDDGDSFWKDRMAMIISGPCTIGCMSHGHFFGANRELPILFATIRAEIITYRPLNGKDPWISPHFDMRAVVACLKEGSDLRHSIRLTDKGMLKHFCDGCGSFKKLYSGNRGTMLFPGAKDVMAWHFSNLEDWSRSPFLHDIRWLI